MSRTLELNCLVQGDDLRHIFQIEIASTKAVSALKKRIWIEKKPTFDHVPADTLVLWKVSVPADANLEQELGNLDLTDAKSLPPLKRLSNVFLDLPEESHIHLVVRAPPAGERRSL